MIATHANAAAMIREIDPGMAALWMARPFHRAGIVSALFDSMRKCDHPEAYRVRVVLNSVLDAQAADRAAAIAAEL